jgi:hypothetical protein
MASIDFLPPTTLDGPFNIAAVYAADRLNAFTSRSIRALWDLCLDPPELTLLPVLAAYVRDVHHGPH